MVECFLLDIIFVIEKKIKTKRFETKKENIGDHPFKMSAFLRGKVSKLVKETDSSK